MLISSEPRNSFGHALGSRYNLILYLSMHYVHSFLGVANKHQRNRLTLRCEQQASEEYALYDVSKHASEE